MIKRPPVDKVHKPPVDEVNDVVYIGQDEAGAPPEEEDEEEEEVLGHHCSI